MHTAIGDFLYTIGNLPFIEPNGTRVGSECALRARWSNSSSLPPSSFSSVSWPPVKNPMQDLPTVVPQGDATGWVGPALCCMTGIGCPYVCCRQFLVSRGEYALGTKLVRFFFLGFRSVCCVVQLPSYRFQNEASRSSSPETALNNGVPEIYFEGRHVLMSPLSELIKVVSSGDDVIKSSASGPLWIVRVPIGQCGLAYVDSLVQILLPGVHAFNNATFQFMGCATLDSGAQF